jgi:hypothetical protein
MAPIYECPPFYFLWYKKSGITMTPCLNATSCKATIQKTKVVSKSTRVMGHRTLLIIVIGDASGVAAIMIMAKNAKD